MKVTGCLRHGVFIHMVFSFVFTFSSVSGIIQTQLINYLFKDMLMPPPSPEGGDETQDDSGFHSGGMSSSTTSTEAVTVSRTKRKSIIKSSKSTAKRSESQPSRMSRCESMDMKELAAANGVRTRPRMIGEQTVVYGGFHPIYTPHPPHPPPPNPHPPHQPHPPPLASKKGGGTVGRSYLQKLVSLPFLGGRSQPPVYGGKQVGEQST